MTSRPELEHGPRCQRRRAPLLRLDWRSRPELWCPDCGRHALIQQGGGVDPAACRGNSTQPTPAPTQPHNPSGTLVDEPS